MKYLIFLIPLQIFVIVGLLIWRSHASIENQSLQRDIMKLSCEMGFYRASRFYGDKNIAGVKRIAEMECQDYVNSLEVF